MIFAVFRTTQLWDVTGGTRPPCEGAGYIGSGHYTIEIADLPALMAFANTYGRIIIDGESIEIYDEYRE